MKNVKLLVLVFFAGIVSVTAQSVFGKWKTVDDKTGDTESIVEIYEKDGKVYAKVAEILNPERKNKKCTECSGSDKNKPIEGLVIVKGLEKDGDEWSGGKILDPKNGKQYKCYIKLENANKLKVRGYVGFALVGRTQYWYRN